MSPTLPTRSWRCPSRPWARVVTGSACREHHGPGLSGPQSQESSQRSPAPPHPTVSLPNRLQTGHSFSFCRQCPQVQLPFNGGNCKYCLIFFKDSYPRGNKQEEQVEACGHWPACRRTRAQPKPVGCRPASPDRTREVSRPRSTRGCDQLNPGGGREEAAPSERLLHAPLLPPRPRPSPPPSPPDPRAARPPSSHQKAACWPLRVPRPAHRPPLHVPAHPWPRGGRKTPCDCAEVTAAGEHKRRKGMEFTSRVLTRIPPQRMEQRPGPPPSHPCFFEEGSGPRVLLKSGPGNRVRSGTR